MRSISTIVFWFLMNAALGQQDQLGTFQQSADIGNPKLTGSTTYDALRQRYTLRGGGYNIGFNRDEFQYVYKKISGDFILTAHVELSGEGFDPHRKTGWMIRASLEPQAAQASAIRHGDGLTMLQWRPLDGAFVRDPEDQAIAPKKHYTILQLERSGNQVIMRAAHTGEPLQVIGSTDAVAFPKEVFAGLFICAHHPDKVEEGTAWNVRIDKPVADDHDPQKEGWLGCRLETMNVFNGERNVIHESKGRFEAPNWMPDGKHLLFNENGSLFTIPIEGGTPKKLDTGFANRNNNDHGISFDGTTLAISHHRDGLPGGGSTIYVLPLQGGTPRQVTEKTPSYWHGWAPNGKDVVYVGQRDGKVYDIYKIAINGGKEIQLTQNQGTHVDGPEYSPDGRYIYYNGNQSGTMQIWRMRPDGSGKEQLTFDAYNDWFPHISPDGKWMVFLSFPPDIDVDSHPSYKRVMLRLMPVAGGAPRVIAYLYGGQGTINVPSWSPDSKHIAFVSNSEKY